jgi:hypothetical protein
LIVNHFTYNRPSLDIEYDYVGIIDCLTPADRQKFGITEGISDCLNPHGITTAIARVNTLPELLGAIDTFRKEAVGGKRFMLHFVAHGDEKGIDVGRDTADWHQLRTPLERVHHATNYTLLLNLSTCKGLHGIKIASDSGAYPFFGLIGAKDDLEVADALAANRILYGKWIAGMPVQSIVAETNADLGSEILFVLSSEGFRKIGRSGNA